jgi:hypothetical protein
MAAAPTSSLHASISYQPSPSREEAGRGGWPPCAVLETEARRQGRPIELRDLLILAIAKAQDLGVATRNVDHFRGFGIPVYDPFNDVQIL